MERCAWFVRHGERHGSLLEIFIRNHYRELAANRRTVLWKIRSGRAACPWLAPAVLVFHGVPGRADRIVPRRPRRASGGHRTPEGELGRSTRVEKVRARP